MKLTVESLNASLAALNIDDTDANIQGWATCACPTCGDAKGFSLRININTGEYKCFRCQATSKGNDGQPLDLFISDPEIPSLSITRNELPPLTDELIARYHRLLTDSPQVISDLERKRGWTKETIIHLGIGWDGSHLWLPIRDINGTLVNARMYDPFKRTSTKSFHYANPDGLKRTAVFVPFGAKSLEGHDTIWMFEGEPDGTLAGQLGFPAILITGGAGTWIEEVVSVIGTKKVVLCYDMDAAGRRGARSIKARLENHNIEVLHLQFPLTDSAYKDFSDAINKDGRDARWFKDRAKEQWDGQKPTDGSDIKKPILVKLGGGVPHEPIILKAHVLGTHTVPMLVPQMIEAKCRMNWSDKCSTCPVQNANGLFRREVDPESEELMLLCATPVKMQKGSFKHMCGIPARCPMVRFDTPGMWQVQNLRLVPPMTERHGGDSTIRAALFVSPADGRPPAIRANQLYMFNGKIEPDVLTNEWTLLSADARPAEDDIDSFRMDAGMLEHLHSEFNPAEWTVAGIEETLLREEKSISRHVTRIYGRLQLLRLIDLTYHSVLKFPFRGRIPQRGWLSLCVFGDTRTGKSETMSSFATYIGLGKYVMDPANTTYAGLVGGLQQVGKGDKSWTITWGLIPTNDRGLVVLDELSSLSTNDIGKMSGMRSSGIAEITKIRSSMTSARTRLIMGGNPRGLGRMLSSYGTPIEGLMELIGAPEDVARFDLACAVKQGLNKDKADIALGPQPPPAMIDLRRALVLFAWSRSENHITWEDGAEVMAGKIGEKMASDYDRRIPLVEPSEQDVKIARVAVATACRTFSVTKDDPNVVYVRKCHVLFAEKVMRDAFDGELGYHDYSRYLKRHRLDVKAAKDHVIGMGRDVSRTCRALLSIRRVNVNSIGMVLALDSTEARDLIAKLAQLGAARFDHENNRNTAMTWTPEFMTLLRNMEEVPPEIEGQDLIEHYGDF